MTLLRTLPHERLAPRRLERSPELRRTWLFGAGADSVPTYLNARRLVQSA